MEAAVAALGRLGTLRARSSLYRSKAWGIREQPDFINAAVVLETRLSPHDLLRALKFLEAALGRLPTYRWGPRAIDCDILAYDDLVLTSEELTLPHPRLFERAFALAPLAEIEPRYLPAYERLPDASRAEVRREDRPNQMHPVEEKAKSIWEETLERVRCVVAACVEGDLERVRVEEGAFSLEVRRTRRVRADVEVSSAPSDARPEIAPLGAAENGAAASDEPVLLKADFVGILRFSRPVVTEGSAVNEDRELAYVESLGTRNPVRATGRGKITAVYVTDGQAVDYGHPLFAVVYA